MFSYTNDELKLYVTENLKDDTFGKKCRIRVIVRIALMVKKFHNRVSQRYKDEKVAYIFDRNSSIEELRKQHDFSRDQIYLIRKFEVSLDEVSNSNFDFVGKIKSKIQNNGGQNEMYSFTQAVKYLCKNSITSLSKLIDPVDILDLIKTLKDNSVKNELVWILGYTVEKTIDKVNNQINSMINGLILNSNDIHSDCKAFLVNKLESNKSISKKYDDEIESESKNCKSITVTNRNSEKKKNKLVVTKTIQTIKSSIKNQNSEESENKIINLASALKNRNRKAIITQIQDYIETENEQLGDSRSILRSTWAECLNLYQLAKQNKIIKSDDKDNYLPSKLFGYHFFDCEPRTRCIYKFYIERMIVSTFLKMSKKQALNKNAIEKLLMCIDSLENIIKNRLEHKNVYDLYEKFISGFTIFYSKFESLDGPDLLKNLSEKLINITMRVEKGWFSTYKVVKNYERSDVTILIRQEIEQFRMDAVVALFHSVQRNKKILTSDNLKKIQKCINNKDDETGCEFDDNATEKFKNYLFRILDFVESNPDLDYSALFQTYFELLNSKSFSVQNAKSAVNFLNNQAKDRQRCEKLFTPSVVDGLILLLSESELDNDIKGYLVDAINNYLEHDFSSGLSKNQLKNLVQLISSNSSSRDVIDAAFLSILLTVEKTQSIPASIRELLLTKSKILFDNYGNFIVLILSRIKDQAFNQQELEILSQELESEYLLVDQDDSMMKFEKPSNLNSHCTPISLVVSRLILDSIEKQVQVSSKTIDNLLLAIGNGNDKQTKIISAKCIFRLSYYCEFDGVNLNSVQNHVSHDVYDISVYMHTAFLKSLAKRSQKYEAPIESIHLENLSALHVKESLKIGDYDFSKEINTSILQILKNEARKQKFEDDNLFVLFDEILYANENHRSEALDILEVYTRNKYTIPESTIEALENVLMSSADFFEQTLIVIQYVIQNGQTVNNTSLCLFIDNLYMSDNSRRRLRAFKLLEQARMNQDISDEIFFKVELEKAAFGLSRVENKHLLLDFIRKQTEKGLKLSIETMISLEKQIENAGVIDILLNVTNMKQILNYNLLNKLTCKFIPNSSVNEKLIQIFLNVSQNNQKLSHQLLNKLELALDNQAIEDVVLSIFVQRAQKGDSLSSSIIRKFLKKIKTEEILILRQEYLCSLASLIHNNSNLISDSIKTELEIILSTNLYSENTSIQKICINGWRSLINNFQVDTKYLTQLIEFETNSKCDESVKENLKMLLLSMSSKQIGLTQDLKDSIELKNLKFKSNDEFLDKISVFMNNETKLLMQNYKHLANVIDQSSSSLKLKTLKLLNAYKHTNEMSNDLTESICFLCESSKSIEIKSLCLSILNLVDCKVDYPSKIKMKVLKIKSEIEKANHYENKFTKSELYNTLRNQFKLDNAKIRDLLKLLKIDQNLLEINDLNQLVSIALRKNINYYQNYAFVFLIEQILLSGYLTVQALICYNRIIEEKKYQNLEVVIEKIFLKQQHFNVEILSLVIECIYISVKVTKMPLSCLEFLEKNIEHKNEFIRSCSFKGLKKASTEYENFQSVAFNSWCDEKLGQLSKLTEKNLTPTKKYLDYLEIITSLNSIDLEVLKSKPQKIWKRELLISSLFQLLVPTYSEKMTFYVNWLRIEEKFKYIDSIKILIQIHDRVSTLQSMREINEAIVIIKELPFDIIIDILRHDLGPFQSLQLKWCSENIQKILNNKEEIDEDYLENLAQKMLLILDINLIQQIFQSILSIDNLKAFDFLIEFCYVENVKVDDISFENVETVHDLHVLIQVKHICNNLQASVTQNDCDLFNLLFNLLKKNWTYDQLNRLIEAIRRIHLRKPVQDVVDALKIMDYYNLSSTKCKEVLTVILKSKHMTDLLNNLNELAVGNTFQQKGKIKDTAELLTEFSSLNDNDEQLLNYIRTETEIQLKNIKSETFRSAILSNDDVNMPICKWGEKFIRQWADKVASSHANSSTEEAIAVIKRANFIFTGFELTDTQILSSLISLKPSEESKGKLLQVATGEGKSTIVCILAIINALTIKNGQVNVITSSPVLAERDAKEKAKLFKMFNLTCSNNNDASLYIKGPKECYKANIVYGEVSQFQFDQLRDEYSQLGTLARRQCRIAIIDEVDAMLIDDNSKISRLSSTAAGMDHFQAIYTYIWQKLLSIKEKLIFLNNKMYLLDGKVNFNKEKIVFEFADKQGEINRIEDLEAYIKENPNVNTIGKRIDKDIDEFLKSSLDDYINDLIEKEIVEVPDNFKIFFEKQRPKWILNAIEALNYQENVHYVVQEGQIKPVDYFSTGIVQSATNWSDGLHQFLQLKHNLKMTCETFTTNFLSNIGFIKGYTKVIGLTGTLGSKKARSILKEVYSVDLISVPELRQKQYIEYPTIVAEKESKWIEEICSAALTETKKDRGILVICETIEQANVIGERLKSKHRPSAIKLYTMNNMNQEKQVEKILQGEIIIATNLAGRGTDIQTDAIEHAGGLHVILIFMPNNQRVENQAFGRTARQGKRGTGQMILNMMNLIGFNNVNHTKVKNERDSIESKQLTEFRDNDLKLINAKDELFTEFCKFLNFEIRSDIRNKSSVWQKTKSCFTHIMPSVYEYNVLMAIEEQWAMFLHCLDDKSIPIEDSKSKYNELESRLRNDYKNNKVIKNLYYHVVVGNDMIVNNSDPKKAIQHFKNAVDSKFCGSAHVGIAWASILISKKNIKREFLESFRKAIDILSDEIAEINSRQMILKNIQAGFVNSELDKQLSIKVTILGSYLNSVQNCVSVIKRSLRLIDIVREDEEIIEFYNDLERTNNKKVEGVVWDNNSTYMLTFNNLTSREDTITIDQALQNIDVALKEISNKGNLVTGYMDKLKSLKSRFKSSPVNEASMSSKYDDIQLKLSQINLSSLKLLLSTNKEFGELHPEQAISKLKESRSYLNAVSVTNSFEVDMQIIYSDKEMEILRDQQINELISHINKQNDQILRYSLKIKEANTNKINNYYKYVDQSSSSNFRIQFPGIENNQENSEALKLLSDISSEYVSIELISKRSILLPIAEANFFNDKNISKIVVCKDENKIYKTVENDELVTILMKADDKKSDPIYIKIECLQTFATNILKKFPDSTVNVVFNKVKYSNLIKYLEKDELDDKTVTFSFENLNKSTADNFIVVLREQSFDFSLEFKNLNYKQIIAIISNCHIEQEDIEISNVKELKEMFMKDGMPVYELAEYSTKGIEYTIEINEKRFVPWFSVVAVACLGTVQVVIGAVLFATGFGATLGMSMISEGLSDLFYAYRAYSRRQFSWNDYATQKAISIAISVATAGLSSVKDASKGALTIAGETSKEIVEAGATQFIANGKTAAQQIAKTGGNLKSLAFKYIGTKAGEAVVREGLNTGVQYLSNLSFDIIKPQISEFIQEKVKITFCKDQFNQLLRKMYALDTLANAKTLQGKIDKIVADSINPERGTMSKYWNSIGVPLLKGILSDEKYFGNGFSMGLRIAGILNGLYAVQVIIDNIYDDLVKKLTQIDKNSLTITLILHEYLKLEKESARSIASNLKSNSIDEEALLKVNYSDVSECELEKKIEIFKKKTDDDKVTQFLISYCEQYASIELDSFSIVIKSVSNKITDQIISIIQSQMITPWSTLAVSGVTDALSKRVQHYCLVNESQNTDAQNEEEKLYKKLKEKREKNEELSDKEIEFLNGYQPFNTFDRQIRANAKEYIIAYTKSKAAYFAKTQSNNENVSEKVKDRANDVEFQKKPASMAEMSQMADKIKEKYNIDVKIVDDKNYQRTQEEIDSGVEIIYIEKGGRDENNVEQIGHAMYIDKNGNCIDINTEPNDCVYGVFCKILESNNIAKSIDDFRSETAEGIRKNANYEKVLEAEKYMHERYPQEANSLLCTAGLKYIENDDKLETEDDDLKELDDSIKEKNKNKRGTPYDYFFTAKVKAKSQKTRDDLNIELPQEEHSCHHLIPNNELLDLLRATESLLPDERKKILDNYLNKPHIKSVIVENNLLFKHFAEPINLKPNHGKLIHAAVSNNPHNLFYGPGYNKAGKSHRGREPGSVLDNELYDKQTETYKEQVNETISTKSLDEFANLPEPQPVKFEQYKGPPGQMKEKGKIKDKYYAKP